MKALEQENIPRCFGFDLEGTLVDLERFHILAFEEVAKSNGIVFGEKEFRNFIGAGDRAISLEIARLLGQEKPEPDEIRSEKMRVYRELLRSHSFDPRPGVGEYLEQAKVLGGDLALASLTPEEDAIRILEASRLRPFFKFILTENSVSKLKPDPEVYIKTAELLQAPTYLVLIHEDSPTGVAAAKTAGSPVVAFPVHENLTFNPQPDAIFYSWVGLDPRNLTERLFRHG